MNNKVTHTPLYGLMVGLGLPFILWPILIVPIVGWIIFAAGLFMPLILPFIMKKGNCPNCQKKNRFTKSSTKCGRCKKVLFINGNEVAIGG